MKATEVTAGLPESIGSLLPGIWRDSLHVICGLTACTPGSAPGPTLGNEYGKTLPFCQLLGACGNGISYRCAVKAALNTRATFFLLFCGDCGSAEFNGLHV